MYVFSKLSEIYVSKLVILIKISFIIHQDYLRIQREIEPVRLTDADMIKEGISYITCHIKHRHGKVKKKINENFRQNQTLFIYKMSSQK